MKKSEKWERAKEIIAVIMVIVGIVATEFLIFSSLMWIVLRCFGLVFSWKIAIGAYTLLVLIKGCMRKEKK